jgi:hypothetical protein
MAIANITNNILTDSGVATSSLLPLTGGTLTGALSGTSATFSLDATINGVKVGKGAGSGTFNTAIGYIALSQNTTGSYNSAFGAYSLSTNSNGIYNAAIGYQALLSNTSGSSNVSVGSLSMHDNTTGQNNTAIGTSSGYYITTGSYNTIVGNYAGTTTLDSNVILADGNGNLRFVGFSTGNVYLGAGTTLPTDSGYKLDVNGTGRFTGALSGTSASFSSSVTAGGNIAAVATGTANAFLTASGSTGSYSGVVSLQRGGTEDGVLYTASTNYSPVTGVSAADIVLYAAGGGRSLRFATSSSSVALTLASTGAATFSGEIKSGDTITLGAAAVGGFWTWGATTSFLVAGTGKALNLNPNGSSGSTGLSIATTGAATFSSSVTANAGFYLPSGGSGTSPTISYLNSLTYGLNASGGNAGIYFGNTYNSDYSTGMQFRVVNSGGSNVTAMTISPTGNVGIGVTPSAWSTSNDVRAIQLKAGAFWNYSDFSTYFGLNYYWDGSVRKYIISDYASEYQQISGEHRWFSAPSGTAGTTATFTERMRITSGGAIKISAGSPPTSGDGLEMWYNGTNSVIGSIERSTGTNKQLYFFASNTIFENGGSERMRITSGGFLKASNTATYYNAGLYHELRVNTSGNWVTYITNTASTDPYGVIVHYTGASPNGGGSEFFYAFDTGGARFGVRSNGGIANYQANDVNLSDIRTKKDIIPLESYWDKFKAIEIVKFKYKDQTHDDFNIGVIAQQVEEIAPEFVDIEGWDKKPKLDEDGNEIVNNEEPLKAIYTADLHHATIKVLQECMAKIEEQQAQIEELKQLINK